MLNDDPPVIKTDTYGPNDSVWSEKSYEEYINPTITKTDAFDPFKNETKESEIVRKIVKDKITIDTERQLLSFITWWSDGEINKHNYKIIDYADGIVFTEKQESLHLIDNYYQDKTKTSYVVDLNNYTIRYKYYRYHESPFIKKATITIRNLILLCQPSDQSDGDIAGGAASGTAFFISKKGHLLTNNHVVKGCSVSKITYFNKEYDAKLIATDKTLDLALLKAKVKPKSFIQFSKDEPKKLQKIYVAGYPLGKGLSDDLKITTGIISALKGYEDNSNEIQVDAAINPGNSGGPIVNEKGELVAIAVSGLDKAQNINFGIKSSAAENFLKSNKVSPNKSLMSFSTSSDELLEILEESTVYTFCN